MVLLLLLTVLAMGLYWAWDSVRAERAEERQAETAAERGAHLFAQNCRLCHGRTGKGASEDIVFPGVPLNIEPNRPTDAAELKSLQLRLGDTIRCGRAGTIMPAWHLDYGGSLNDEQIRQLVVLITTNAGDAWEKELKYSTSWMLSSSCRRLPLPPTLHRSTPATAARSPARRQRPRLSASRRKCRRPGSLRVRRWR